MKKNKVQSKQSLIEVTAMDLFWSGLARRASEHTWNAYLHITENRADVRIG